LGPTMLRGRLMRVPDSALDVRRPSRLRCAVFGTTALYENNPRNFDHPRAFVRLIFRVAIQ
jgi:hypothetical protein